MLILKLFDKSLTFIMTLFLFLYSTTQTQAGGPWHDQYCDVETTTVRIIDTDGN